MAGTKRKWSGKQPFGKSDLSLLRTPLQFLQSEHARHRELCRALEELADAEIFDRALAGSVAHFLETDMTLHVLDEEEDIFPLVLKRVKAIDDADRIIATLSGEHAADEALAREIAAGLEAAIASSGTKLPSALRNALLTFTDRQLRHLSVENAILLPLASSRLTRRDLTQVAESMAARRNIRLHEVAS